ncbi:hypothetical protein STTU_p0044 (plasmid) [Streptomyces sp. Tu6071]|nr:hypothetical protein STTU_p0044 [Streptomyces sp. Tu6071]
MRDKEIALYVAGVCLTLGLAFSLYRENYTLAILAAFALIVNGFAISQERRKKGD